MSSLAKAQHNEAEQYCDAGLTAFESGHFEPAIETLRTAIELGRDDVKVRFALAASYYNCKKFSSCIPMLEAILRASAPPAGAQEVLARAYLAVGISSREQADFLLREKSSFPSRLKDAAALAVASFLENNTPLDDTAIPVLEEACNLEPLSSCHITALVQIMADQQDWGKGVAYASRLQLTQHNDLGISLYSQCLSQLGDLSDQAATIYQRQLENHAEDADVRMRLGQSQIRSKRLSDAIATYQGGLARNGLDIKLRYHLALVNLMAEKIEDSIAELQVLLRTDGFQAYRSKDDIYRLLGRCFIRKGMFEAALKQYLLAERSQENTEELYKLGELFESRGDFKNARACWEEIYATDVRFRDVSTKIAVVGT
jgi:tetratricopeptide (TPR) repeat protein